MVFPSALFNVEPGMASQVSGFVVLALSFLIHRMKKWVLIGALLISSLLLLQGRAHAAVAAPSMQYPLVMPYPGYPMGPYLNNFNFYTQPWGMVPPMYLYPNLPPSMGIYPQNYFTPHLPSPYGPGNYCPTCIQPLPGILPNHPIAPYHPNTPVS